MPLRSLSIPPRTWPLESYLWRSLDSPSPNNVPSLFFQRGTHGLSCFQKTAEPEFWVRASRSLSAAIAGWSFAQQRTIAFAAEIFGEDDGFRQVFHGPAQAPAFVSEAQVGFFLGEVETALQQSFGAFDQLAGLQLTAHFLGFF